MREKREKQIDGVTYKLQQLPGFRAGKLWWRLQGIIGPVLAKAGSGFKEADFAKGVFDTDLDLAVLLPALGGALETLAAHMDENAFERLIREVLDGATMVNETGGETPILAVYDNLMAGKPLLQLKLLLAALEVNFEDFWPALAARFQQEAERASVLKASSTLSPAGPVTA